MAETSVLDLAVNVLHELLRYNRTLFSMKRRIPVDFSEFSEYAINVYKAWPDDTWSRYFWDLLKLEGYVLDLDGRDVAAADKADEHVIKVWRRDKARNMPVRRPVVGFNALGSTDLEDIDEKTDIVLGILSQFGKWGASFNRLYRLCLREKIPKGDLIVILD